MIFFNLKGFLTDRKLLEPVHALKAVNSLEKAIEAPDKENYFLTNSKTILTDFARLNFIEYIDLNFVSWLNRLKPMIGKIPQINPKKDQKVDATPWNKFQVWIKY